MSQPDLQRMALFIDVLSLPRQEARALARLKPADLVGAILSEFRELEQLGDQPGEYELRDAEGRPLDPDLALGKQVRDKASLVLIECPIPLPPGTVAPSSPVYLREKISGKVFRIGWLPAIIGRADPDLPNNERVAVNLTALDAGQRVSRRHAQLVEVDGRLAIVALGANPISLLRDDGSTEPIGEMPHLLTNDSLIRLDRSGIVLKVLLGQPAPPADNP